MARRIIQLPKEVYEELARQRRMWKEKIGFEPKSFGEIIRMNINVAQINLDGAKTKKRKNEKKIEVWLK